MGFMEPMAIMNAVPDGTLSAGPWLVLWGLMVSILGATTLAIIMAARPQRHHRWR